MIAPKLIDIKALLSFPLRQLLEVNSSKSALLSIPQLGTVFTLPSKMKEKFNVLKI